MTTKIYTPGISVKLTKLVSRKGGQAQSFASAFSGIDLTPYLGSQGAVRTIKDLHQPAGGFSITFADRLVPSFADSAYALCEPMDLVEIRASRTPERYVGTDLPLIMRGFVSAVERQESMSSDGTPQRTVTVSGQDMGKLLLTNHIYFEVAITTDNAYLTTFHLLTSQGIDVGTLPVGDFMTQLIQNIVNKKIEQLNVFAEAQVKPFSVQASVPDGVVLPTLTIGLDQISIWQLAQAFADEPFNEMFIRDQEAGPAFFFRPAPFRTLTEAAYIMPGAADPGNFTMDISQVVAISMSRTDSRVGNYFKVNPGASQLDTNAYLNIAALQAGQPLDFSYPNNAPELFGVRKMTAGTNLLPQSMATPVNMMKVAQQGQGINNQTQWYQARAEQLKQMNRDNSAFEEGALVVQGNEDLIIGIYLELTRGELTSSQYITQVSHNFTPLATWTSSLRVIRGDGFYKRNQTTASPYIGEGRRGPFNL